MIALRISLESKVGYILLQMPDWLQFLPLSAVYALIMTLSFPTPVQASIAHGPATALPRFGVDWTFAHHDTYIGTAGLPPGITEAYTGFTGPKYLDFPSDPNLSPDQYPDVTEEFVDFRDRIIDQYVNGRWAKPLHKARLLNLMLKHFPTARAWDTKYNPYFPGRDEEGRIQYALYKDRVVSTNYLSNNFYAQICAAAGFPLSFAKLAARMNACGLDRLYHGKLPDKEHRHFRDTPEDQRAIVSGYFDYNDDNPWDTSQKNLDPSEPYNE